MAVEFLRRADAIFTEEIRRAGLYDEAWEASAVLLPPAGVVRQAKMGTGPCEKISAACHMRRVPVVMSS